MAAGASDAGRLMLFWTARILRAHDHERAGCARSGRRMTDIAAIAARAPVIPVLTIERLADAVPLAKALVRGGLPVLEITFRTGAALEALRAIAGEVPGAVVGAGTVLNARQLDQARRAGARFAVSPGCTPALASAA